MELIAEKKECAKTMIQILKRRLIQRVYPPCLIQKQRHSTGGGQEGGGEPTIPITYQLPVSSSQQEPELVTVKAREGENLMALAHRNDIELEGACEGKL
jgi:hypothetical protein